MPKQIKTHEDYVNAVYALALKAEGITAEDRKRLQAIKLVYGDGPDGGLGITRYNRWQLRGGKKPKLAPFVGVCGHMHSSTMQLCDTILHELGHVMAGPGTGHGPEWQKACERMGFTGARATSGSESWDGFTKDLRRKLKALPKPRDGIAVVLNGAAPIPGAPPPRIRPCSLGHGTQGGTSRGPGSGSRQLLWECGCKPKPVKIRHAGRDLDATCNKCHRKFRLVESSVPVAQQD